MLTKKEIDTTVEFNYASTTEQCREIYEYGQKLYANGEYNEAFKYIKYATEHGNMDATSLLGDCYYYGHGVDASVKAAEAFYRQATMRGHEDAKMRLRCIEQGQPIPERVFNTDNDSMETIKDYGETEVLSSVYESHETSEEVSANELYQVGVRHYLGLDGNPIDYEKAIKFINMAALQCHDEAAFLMGVIFENGNGVAKNRKLALEWYQKAKQYGNEQAIERINELEQELEADARSNALKEQENSFQKCQKSVEEGNVNALCELAYKLAKGEGVQADVKKAISCFEQAEAAGVENVATKIFSLAEAFFKGQGVPMNKAVAAELYTTAAKMGHAMSQYNIGYMYETGDGINPSIENARYWYLRAVRNDYQPAEKRLKNLPAQKSFWESLFERRENVF